MEIRVTQIGSTEELMDGLPQLEAGEYLAINLMRNTPFEFRQRLRLAKAIVSDFDGTLVADSQHDRIRARIAETHPELLAEDAAALKRYVESDRNSDDQIQLALSGAERMAKAQLTFDDLYELASEHEPREGAVELMDSFDDGLTAIASMGYVPYIMPWAEVHLKDEPWVFALRMESGIYVPRNGSAQIASSDIATVITDHNKGYITAAFRVANGLAHHEVLTIGDAPTDERLLDPRNLSVMIFPKTDSQEIRQRFRREGLPALFPRCGAILFSDSLMSLVDMRN